VDLDGRDESGAPVRDGVVFEIAARSLYADGGVAQAAVGLGESRGAAGRDGDRQVPGRIRSARADEATEIRFSGAGCDGRRSRSTWST